MKNLKLLAALSDAITTGENLSDPVTVCRVYVRELLKGPSPRAVFIKHHSE